MNVKSFGGICIRKSPSDSCVIFVHGILSHAEQAWSDGANTSWPKLVEAESTLDFVGIYTFSYRSDLFSRNYSIGDVVDSIREFFYLEELWQIRRIIFVCHSMGGIAVRRFIVVNQTKFIENRTDLGLFLIASPSLGAKDANHLAILARFIGSTQAAALRFSQTNTWLNDLDKEFLTLKEGKRISLRGKELIEDEAIRLKKFFGLSSQVVEPFAAGRYFGEPFKVPKSNHSSIAKPSDATAIQHRLLVRFIADMLETETTLSKWALKDNDYNEKLTPEDSKLELVDIGIEHGDFPSQILDIKLRNIGSRVAYLTRAILLVEKTWKISPVSWLLAVVQRSEEYDVRFARENTPYSLTVSLSQAIPADDVDRFALRLLMETHPNDNYEYAVKFRVRLEYDGDAKVLETGEILYWQYGGLDHPYADIDAFLGRRLGGLVEDDVRQDEFKYSEEGGQLMIKRIRDIIARNLEFIADVAGQSILRSTIADRRLYELKEGTTRVNEFFEKRGWF